MVTTILGPCQQDDVNPNLFHSNESQILVLEWRGWWAPLVKLNLKFSRSPIIVPTIGYGCQWGKLRWLQNTRWPMNNVMIMGISSLQLIAFVVAAKLWDCFGGELIYKFKASIVDHVRLTAHKGHVMLT